MVFKILPLNSVNLTSLNRRQTVLANVKWLEEVMAERGDSGHSSKTSANHNNNLI